MTEHFFDHNRLDVYRTWFGFRVRCDSRCACCFRWHESGNGSRIEIQTGSNCRDVDSDGDEIRWCLGNIERVKSVRRARARRRARTKRCRRRPRSAVFDLYCVNSSASLIASVTPQWNCRRLAPNRSFGLTSMSHDRVL